MPLVANSAVRAEVSAAKIPRKDFRFKLIWLASLAVAGLLVYQAGLGIPYFSDDFQYVHVAPDNDVFYFFTHANPYNPEFYRPLNSAILIMVQHFFGWATWPVHLVTILVHVLLAWLVYLFMMRAQFTRLQAALGSGLMLISQANAIAVLENDTLSQVAGTALGCLTLWLLYLCYFEQGTTPRLKPNYGFYALSLPVFALCLSAKETSVSFLILAAGVISLHHQPGGKWQTAFRRILQGLPFALITAGYMMVRAALGLTHGRIGHAHRYEFWPGLNVIRNFAQDVLAASLPVSSVKGYLLFVTGRYLSFALIAGMAAAIIIITAAGAVLTQQRRLLLVLGLAFCIGLFPSVLLTHAGELYLYNSMPFLAVIAGAGMGELLMRYRLPMTRGVVLHTALVLLAASYALAIHQKATMMQANGSRAAELLCELKPYFPVIPVNGQLVLVNPTDNQPEYSDFVVNGFNVLKDGLNIVNYEAGRTDFRTEIVSSPARPSDNRRLVLTLRGNTVTPVGYGTVQNAHVPCTQPSLR